MNTAIRGGTYNDNRCCSIINGESGDDGGDSNNSSEELSESELHVERGECSDLWVADAEVSPGQTPAFILLFGRGVKGNIILVFCYGSR